MEIVTPRTTVGLEDKQRSPRAEFEASHYGMSRMDASPSFEYDASLSSCCGAQQVCGSRCETTHAADWKLKGTQPGLFPLSLSLSHSSECSPAAAELRFHLHTPSLRPGLHEAPQPGALQLCLFAERLQVVTAACSSWKNRPGGSSPALPSVSESPFAGAAGRKI